MVALLLLVLSTSSAQAQKKVAVKDPCRSYFEANLTKDRTLLLLKNHAAILKNCGDDSGKTFYSDRDKNPFWGTLATSQIRRASEILMADCTRRKDPHSCKTEVNQSLETIKKINGGSFGMNERDIKQKQAESFRMAAGALRQSNAKAQLFCCPFANRLVYSDNASMDGVCDAPPKPCAGVMIASPIERTEGVGPSPKVD